MIAYISGPMTGLPDQNYAAFQTAAEALRGQGIQVISPHEITPPGVGPWSWEAHMRVDLAALLTADVIVLLPGWETSRGARLEKTVADALGMLVDFTFTITHGDDSALLDAYRDFVILTPAAVFGFFPFANNVLA